MHFDAVLDQNMNPIFNGTPEETKKWLEDQKCGFSIWSSWRVCIGETMAVITVQDYCLRE